MCSDERLRLVGGLVICKMGFCAVGIVGVSLVAEVGLLWGVEFMQVGSGMGCALLWFSFIFGFCWFLHLVQIMVSVEM